MTSGCPLFYLQFNMQWESVQLVHRFVCVCADFTLSFLKLLSWQDTLRAFPPPRVCVQHGNPLNTHETSDQLRFVIGYVSWAQSPSSQQAFKAAGVMPRPLSAWAAVNSRRALIGWERNKVHPLKIPSKQCFYSTQLSHLAVFSCMDMFSDHCSHLFCF